MHQTNVPNKSCLALNKYSMRVRKALSQLSILASAGIVILTNSINAFASGTGFNIDTKYRIGDLSGVSIEGIILGFVFSVSALTGIVLLIQGFTGFVTARQEGDGASTRQEVGKMVGGAIMVGLPLILGGVGLITS